MKFIRKHTTIHDEDIKVPVSNTFALLFVSCTKLSCSLQETFTEIKKEIWYIKIYSNPMELSIK